LLVNAIEITARDSLEAVTNAVAAQARSHASSRQKDLTRSVTPLVKQQMTPGYDRGIAEAGTGSHRRRVDAVEGHLHSCRSTLFEEATRPVTEGLRSLSEELGAVFRELQNKCVDEMRLTYGCLLVFF
jgi:hypothetical protein